jgi:hypothetical protein
MCTKPGLLLFCPLKQAKRAMVVGESFMERPSKPGNELEGLIHDKLPVLLRGT